MTSKVRASDSSAAMSQQIQPPKKKSKIPPGAAWPRRHLCPPINDIIEYRKDMPPETTEKEVGEAASEYFEWTNNPVLTSADYVTTVTASTTADVQYLTNYPCIWKRSRHPLMKRVESGLQSNTG